jgi:hypothetical protein
VADIVNHVLLLKMELPSHTVLLCDGSFFDWNGDRYLSEDSVFGSIESCESITEGNGDELPTFNISFIPKSTASASALDNPNFQNSRFRLWIAEYNNATGVVTGTPDLIFDGQVDRSLLTLSASNRVVEFDIVPAAERLISRNISNTLTPRFHKSVWSGETGHDNAIDLELSEAWGTESPDRSSSGFGGSGGAGGGVRLGVDTRLQ